MAGGALLEGGQAVSVYQLFLRDRKKKKDKTKWLHEEVEGVI